MTQTLPHKSFESLPTSASMPTDHAHRPANKRPATGRLVAALVGLPLIFGSTLLSAPATQAQVYTSQGGGTALDANLGTNSGGINNQVQSNQLQSGYQNDLVTGNVSGGRQLRVNVGYSAPGALRVGTNTDSLFRDNAYAGPGGTGSVSYYNSYTNPSAAYSTSGVTTNSIQPFYSGTTLVQPSTGTGSGLVTFGTAVSRQYNATTGYSTGYDGTNRSPIGESGTTSNNGLGSGQNGLANSLQDSNPLRAQIQRATLVDTKNPYVSKYFQSASSPLPNVPTTTQLTPTQLGQEPQDARTMTLSLGASLKQFRLEGETSTTPTNTRAPRQGDLPNGSSQPGDQANGQNTGRGPRQDQGNTGFGRDPQAPKQQTEGTGGTNPTNPSANGQQKTRGPGLLGAAGQQRLNQLDDDTAYRQLLDRVINPDNQPNALPADDEDINDNWRLPDFSKLNNDPTKADSRPGAAMSTDQAAQNAMGRLAEQNPQMAQLLDQLNYESPALRSMAGAKESKTKELLTQAESQMADGKYFDAERTYQRVLTLKPDDPLIQVGRAHALLGAGMIRSSALQLRRLLEENPELIAARYEEPLLPKEAQLIRVQDDLTSMADTQDGATSAGLLLAYIGYQKHSKTLVRYGLMIAEDAAPNDDLWPVLRHIWLDTPGTPGTSGNAAPDAAGN